MASMSATETQHTGRPCDNVGRAQAETEGERCETHLTVERLPAGATSRISDVGNEMPRSVENDQEAADLIAAVESMPG